MRGEHEIEINNSCPLTDAKILRPPAPPSTGNSFRSYIGGFHVTQVKNKIAYIPFNKLSQEIDIL